MTLFERLRSLWPSAGRDIRPSLYAVAAYDAALELTEEVGKELFVDPITEAKWAEILAEGERMAERLEGDIDKLEPDVGLDAEDMISEGGPVTDFKPLWDGGTPPAGTVPNCS